ncbi:MAG: HlyC/CorC family transporter [Geminicoccaceae bacterium]|nr:HlyC/CorC family transporter [Geminicoccaceae bacterium]
MRQFARREERQPSLLDNLLRRLKGLASGENENNGLRETLEELLEEEPGASDALTGEERELLLNALSFSELAVDDVMIPRSDIAAVDLATDLQGLVARFGQTGHSRLLVFKDNLDEVVGFIHIRDLLPFWGSDGTGFAMTDVMRKVLVVPPSMRVLDLLLEMRDTRTHIAAVVDEFGGTDGLVTVEDLVQEILGEMHDEHAEAEETPVVTAADGSFETEARLDLDELEERLGFPLLEDEERDEVDTLAGVVFTLVDRVPQVGEQVRHPSGTLFEIVDADPRRIKRVRVTPPHLHRRDGGSGSEGSDGR